MSSSELINNVGVSSGSVKVAFPSYRVFIYGHEVTNDVTAINAEMHDGAAPNMCQITLLNKNDRYIVTTRDVASIKKVNNFYLGSIFSSRMSDKFERNLKSSLDRNAVGLNALSRDNILSRGVVKDADFYVMDEVKRRILESKSIIPRLGQDTASMKDYIGRPLSERIAKYYSKDTPVYPIHDGSPIFHPMDPVRVFMRDPFNPEDWYHFFCGFVSDMTETCDENNARTVSLAVEDPTKLLRYTRVGLNPGIFDKAAVTEDDLTAHSLWSNFLTGLSLPQMFYLLLFGSEKVNALPSKEAMDRIKNQNTRLVGVGHFSYDGSIIATIGDDISKSEDSQQLSVQQTDTAAPSQNGAETAGQVKPQTISSDVGASDGVRKEVLRISVKDAGAWQALLDHKVYPSDLRTMAKDDDRKNEDVMSQRYESVYVSNINDGRSLAEQLFGNAGNTSDQDAFVYDTNKIVEYIGTHPDEYLVDGGRLMMLIPSGIGTENDNIVDKGIIASPYQKTEWSTVGQVMYETVDRIQFVMYCTPRGDIVVEPPMFDADPSFFGEFYRTLEDMRKSPDLAVGNTLDYMGKEDAVVRRPYCDDYVVFQSDTFGWDSTYTDEKVYTIAVADHAIVKNFPEIGRSEMYGGLQVQKLDSLIPLYGLRAATVTQRGYISTPQAAKLFAAITLDKLNADARTVSIRALPNIKMWLNRPIYFEPRNLIGTTKNIGHSITWGASGDMSTSLQINTVRSWDGTLEDQSLSSIRSEKYGLESTDEVFYQDIEKLRTSIAISTSEEEYNELQAALAQMEEAEKGSKQVQAERPDPLLFNHIGGSGGRLLNYQVLWGSAPVPKQAQDQSNSDAQKKEQEERENPVPKNNRIFIHPLDDVNILLKETNRAGFPVGTLYEYKSDPGVSVYVCPPRAQVLAIEKLESGLYAIGIGYKSSSGNVWIFTYYDLANVSSDLSVGSAVSQGDPLGATGVRQSDGVGHLVLHVKRNNQPIEFTDYIKG